MTDYFWTDVGQATERLLNCVILYDDKPVMVTSVEDHEDGHPRARLSNCDRRQPELGRKKLNSPAFKRFRELPKIGWMNLRGTMSSGLAGKVVYMTRETAPTRRHGLCGENTVTWQPSFKADGFALIKGDPGFNYCYKDEGFCDAHYGDFPSLTNILKNIAINSAIAYSRDYCVIHDPLGIKWLMRRDKRVGVFADSNTLSLFSTTSFLREEIMSDKAFTLDNIREMA